MFIRVAVVRINNSMLYYIKGLVEVYLNSNRALKK